MASEPGLSAAQGQDKARLSYAILPKIFYQPLLKSTQDKTHKTWSTIPSTPRPTRSLPILISTPIVNKATTSQPYASEVKEREDLNEELAREMKGHFSGVIPAYLFLDKFLPLQAGDEEPSKEALGKGLNIIPSALESQMYLPFINAIKPHLKDMDIFDTHVSPDTERDDLAPDVSLYPKKVKMKKNMTYFPEMSTFVEFKVSATADPFVDPPNPSSLPADFSFEREEPDLQKNRGQIGSYLAAICGTQFRTHVFSVSVCGKNARFIRWDRSGAIVTARFDYVESPHLLVGFFYRYSRLSRRQQGYDPTVSQGSASEEELTLLDNAGFRKRMQEANKAHREFRTIMVPDRDDPSKEKEKAFLISYPPYYEIRSPFSRATRAMLAFDMTRKVLVFLKDYWRANIDGMEKEGEIYRILQEKKIPHIALFGMGNDVRDQETSTQTWNNKTPPPSWIILTTGPICLRHYRMTLDTVGRGLTDFESSHQFISAIADAMEAHDGAFFDCRILHRDISVGNVIITDENEGLLIDWDLCIKLDEDPSKDKEPSVPRRPVRTGTWQFMSVKLLENPDKRHDHLDDRESAFFVLLWVGLRYTETEAVFGSTFTPAKVLSAFDEIFVDAIGRLLGGGNKHTLIRRYTSQGIRFSERPELDSLMTALASVFDVRYGPEPSAAQIAYVKKALARIEAKEGDVDFIREGLVDHPAYDYQQTMNQLEKRGWLVDTIRKYLDMGEWPNDKSYPQVTVTSHKRKAEKDQAISESRATKKHSSLRPSQSSLP